MTADMDEHPRMEVLTRIEVGRGFKKKVLAQIIRGADYVFCQLALNKCLTT